MSPAVDKRIAELELRLSPRDRQIIMHVARFRLMSGSQLLTVFFSQDQARLCRRCLARLVDLGALERLTRRIGGVRAGSSGHVYRLAPHGQRLVARWRGATGQRAQRAAEPGDRFVRHTLAIADLFVRLRSLNGQLVRFDSEPECWREFDAGITGKATLKPDAYLVCTDQAWEYRWFVEVDLATEGTATLQRKCQAYVDYWRTGGKQADGGVFPRALWLTISDRQAQRLESIIEQFDRNEQRLFRVAMLGSEASVVTTEVGENHA